MRREHESPRRIETAKTRREFSEKNRTLKAYAMCNVVRHPKCGEKLERDLSRTPEANKLKDAIFTAVREYADYLERNGLIWNDNNDDWRDDRSKSLVLRWEFPLGGVITLDGGAVHPEPSYPDEYFDKSKR